MQGLNMRTMSNSVVKRGTLVVFEGCDRSGKTTQCERIVKRLNSAKQTKESQQVVKESAKFMRFPDRSTEIGKAINGYLNGQNELDDHVIHLLFSANRWEKVDELKKALSNGTHVIVDRYAFSGVAFSAAKPGLSLDWCRQPDRGLPKPDLVCFLDVSANEAKIRGGYGDERYEKEEFQAIVRKNYDALMDKNYWKIIDTDAKSPEEVYMEVEELISECIAKPKQDEIEILWPVTTKTCDHL